MRRNKSRWLSGMWALTMATLFATACAPRRPGPTTAPPQTRPTSRATPATRPARPAPGLHEEPSIGLRLHLPKGWKRKDVSRAGVHVMLFGSNLKDLRTRITLLGFPRAYMPKGMATRQAQLAALLGNKVGKTLVRTPWRVGSQSGQKLSYGTGADGNRAEEYGLWHGGRLVILQFAAPQKRWRSLAGLRRRALASLSFFAPQRQPKVVSKKPAATPKKAFVSAVEALRHDVEITLTPKTGAFTARDRLVLRAKHETSTADFKLSSFDSVEVRDDKGLLKHRRSPIRGHLRRLTISLRRPLRVGEKLTLTVTVKTKRYDHRSKGSPISGYVMLGQVTQTSSYSSHVFYYPVDEHNRAGATLRFRLPAGYLAVGPGKRLADERDERGLVQRWRSRDGLIKQLPYGWAVAKYVQLEGRSRSGVPIRVFALPGHEARGKKVLKVAVDAIRFFERRFGPYPSKSVSIAEVKPDKGIAGVSLPGMVLLSPHFFHGASKYTRNKSIVASFRGPLVIVDELSHQYNFYAVALPNALAEGLAQYTDSLFAEHVGLATMAEHVGYYAKNYRVAIAAAPDRPILSPAVYRTRAYMGIVFNKGACVLHMLRRQVGDKAFFSALRSFFRRYRGKRAGLAQLREAMEKASGGRLRWFFEQWYRRSGSPRLSIGWRHPPRRQGQKRAPVYIELRQLQPGKAFRLPLTLELYRRGAKGKPKRGKAKPRLHRITLTQKSQTFSVPFEGDLGEVKIRHAAELLLSIAQ